MSDRVAELVRAARLLDAAKLAEELGDPKTASELFERACEWDAAARAALVAGEHERALYLAALGGCDATAATALAHLATTLAEVELVRVADTLRHRAQLAWAARVYEAAHATRSAADAWERSGNRLRAAELLEAGGDGQGPMLAARVLEVGLRREPDRADLLLALGTLLLRCGKPSPALRSLQRVPDDAREKVAADKLALRALTELGMSDARAEVEARLRAKGETTEIDAPPPHAMTEGASVQARLYGRYEVAREVSSTATARLLECTDVLRGERVAVKLFSAQAAATRGAGRDALAHFAREARVLARLAHPNIVPLHEIIEQGPAIVLEWMPGGTLEEHLAREVFAPARAVDIACSVMSALAEAHRLGVVHRDLKPANILFDAAGTARLTDFGVAHLGDLSVTATAGSFGSLAYMSPEQREGRPATAQSDLFGIGVVLHEMLTGRRPFGSDARARAEMPLSTVHRYLDARHDAALAAFLARDPAMRPPDAFAAQRLLTTLPWPADHDPSRAVSPRRAPSSVHPPTLRLEPLAPAGAQGPKLARDAWLDRPVTYVPLTPRTLERASSFARAGTRALQPVLRVDRESSLLWLGAARGARPTASLTATQKEALGGALDRLHQLGFVHGNIGPETVRVESDGVVLLSPVEDSPGASAEEDVAALARL